jgi:hypothetical protein
MVRYRSRVLLLADHIVSTIMKSDGSSEAFRSMHTLLRTLVIVLRALAHVEGGVSAFTAHSLHRLLPSLTPMVRSSAQMCVDLLSIVVFAPFGPEATAVYRLMHASGRSAESLHAYEVDAVRSTVEQLVTEPVPREHEEARLHALASILSSRVVSNRDTVCFDLIQQIIQQSLAGAYPQSRFQPAVCCYLLQCQWAAHARNEGASADEVCRLVRSKTHLARWSDLPWVPFLRLACVYSSSRESVRQHMRSLVDTLLQIGVPIPLEPQLSECIAWSCERLAWVTGVAVLAGERGGSDDPSPLSNDALVYSMRSCLLRLHILVSVPD